jgi:hypothetical protein
MHFKVLEKQEQANLKCRWKEIIKIAAEINEMKNKRRIKTKNCFFEMPNRISKPVDKLTRRKNNQTNKIRDEKGNIMKDTIEIQILLEYLENVYSSKLGNQEKIDKMLNTYDQPKLYPKEINNLKRSIMSNKIETVIKIFPKKEEPNLEGANSYRPLKN